MRIFVTGVNGQVGWELQRACQPLGEVIGVDRARCDLADPAAVGATLRELRPDVIVNPAAYTNVDGAEADEALATRINGETVAVMAAEAARLGALLVQYSTDYVFDGSKDGPYIETDPPCPINAYGRSKLAGELALRDSSADWLCLRTTWIYANRGRNFLRTVLRLAKERDELRIVGDQFGAPTWARSLADVTAHVVHAALDERKRGRFASGILHATAAGSTSWHGFASAIVDLARQDEKLRASRILPIASADYPSPARRPRNSVLDNTALETRFGVKIPDWRVGLALCLA